MGRELAASLKVVVGDRVNVVSPVGGELGPQGPMPKSRPFRVAGIFYSGMYEYDSKFVYIHLSEAQTFFNIKEVDGEKRILRSEEGSEVQYDLLIAIPAHRGMEVIEKNKMGQNGWIPTNKTKLNMEGRTNVFVIGDTTNIPISKAGSTAHFEAETLGENIAAMIKMGMNTPVRDYDGKVFCFIEAGLDRATYAMFNYTNPPDPKAPTRAMHWFKMAYNKLYWASARGLL